MRLTCVCLALPGAFRLLVAYPTKALANPLFYLKLGLIAVALAILRSIVRRRDSDAYQCRGPRNGTMSVATKIRAYDNSLEVEDLASALG